MISTITDNYQSVIDPMYDNSSVLTVVPINDATHNNNNSNNNNNNNNNNNTTTTTTTTMTGSAADDTVFLPTYASLPTTKLEEEPNPFEESFEVATIEPIKPTLPDKPWTTLGARRPNKYEVETTTFYSHTFDTPKHTRSRKSSTASSEEQPRKRKDRKEPEDEEKRKNFLERNRIAALKCRQRKKQWLQNLQAKVEYLAADNEQYHMQANALKEEIINLKKLLMIHRDCHINPQALKEALNRPIPGVSSHLMNGHHPLL